MKIHTWKELTGLTSGQDVQVERVRLKETGVVIEGVFEPPPLAQLSEEDQVFVAAFVRSHGSIREMERLFGISYPTVKNRLNAISERLGFADPAPPPTRSEVLERLERGEITTAQALELLK